VDFEGLVGNIDLECSDRLISGCMKDFDSLLEGMSFGMERSTGGHTCLVFDQDACSLDCLRSKVAEYSFPNYKEYFDVVQN